jgi:transcriptional regulator NrdR family protein
MVCCRGCTKIFTTMIDDASRYCYVYLLKTKDETLNYDRRKMTIGLTEFALKSITLDTRPTKR